MRANLEIKKEAPLLTHTICGSYVYTITNSRHDLRTTNMKKQKMIHNKA
jgi:hypothetical protein